MVSGWGRAAARCWAMLPAIFNEYSLREPERLRRLDIAALAVLLAAGAAIFFSVQLRRRRRRKSVPWITWNADGASVSAVRHSAENPALWQWVSLGVATLLGVSYSWIGGHWIVLPLFVAGGYLAGWRARKALRQ